METHETMFVREVARIDDPEDWMPRGEQRPSSLSGFARRQHVLGASPEPVEPSTSDLLFGGRSIEGALTGDPATGDATLRFSLLAGVEATVETMPLERAPKVYARMMAGQARFRIVLTINGSAENA